MKEYIFCFNNKKVSINNIYKSSNTEIAETDTNWMQTIYDNIDDQKSFYNYGNVCVGSNA